MNQWDKKGRYFLMQSTRALKTIFKSTFNKDIGLQLWINILSLSSFSTSFITACFGELLGLPLSNAYLKLDITEF